MKFAVFSHCTIDTIDLGTSSNEHIGGAACYCGITAKNLKFDAKIHTKFGNDFPQEFLLRNKIEFENALSLCPSRK
jgi:sugar/nucleoside kinase (ribokinase family)